jgi:hypothetical protein
MPQTPSKHHTGVRNTVVRSIPLTKKMLKFPKLRPTSPTYTTIEASSSPSLSEHGEGKEFGSEQGQIEPQRRSWLRRHWVAIGVHSLLAIANCAIYIAASTKTWDPVHARSESTAVVPA